MLDPKCIYRKSIFAKCTRLACLLSFARLLKYSVQKLCLCLRRPQCTGLMELQTNRNRIYSIILDVLRRLSETTKRNQNCLFSKFAFESNSCSHFSVEVSSSHYPSFPLFIIMSGMMYDIFSIMSRPIRNSRLVSPSTGPCFLSRPLLCQDPNKQKHKHCLF